MTLEIGLELPQFLNVATGYRSFINIDRAFALDPQKPLTMVGQEIEVIAFEDNKYFKFDSNNQWSPVEKEDADHIKIKVFAAGIFQEYNPVHFGADFPDTKSALKFWEQIERRWVKFTQEDLVLGFEKI